MTGDGRDGALWSSNYSGADTLMQSPLALDQEEASALELERGSQVDRYTILERLGAGAMGVVYTAYDPKLDRRIALKLMRAKPGVDPASVAARLLREAQALARLSHPNVVTVHDADSLDDLVYLAMELIEGVNLTHWLAAPGVRGLMVWVIPTDPDDPASEPPHGFNPLNKPAEKVIGQVFTRGDG